MRDAPHLQQAHQQKIIHRSSRRSVNRRRDSRRLHGDVRGVIGGGQDRRLRHHVEYRHHSRHAAVGGYTFDAFRRLRRNPRVLNFGNGRFNATSLNGSLGQLRGRCPDRGKPPGMYTTARLHPRHLGNPHRRFQLPRRSQPQWQALGARPVTEGALHAAYASKSGDFCSSHATPPESAEYLARGIRRPPIRLSSRLARAMNSPTATSVSGPTAKGCSS